MPATVTLECTEIDTTKPFEVVEESKVSTADPYCSELQALKLISGGGVTNTITVDNTAVVAAINNLIAETNNLNRDCEVFTRCMVDDVAGDGSNLVTYVEAYVRCFQDGVLQSTTLHGTFTDSTLQAPYVATNPTLPGDVGADGQVEQHGVLLAAGEQWSPPATLYGGYTVSVDAGNVTFTDSDGAISVLGVGSYTFDQFKLNADTAPAWLVNVGGSATIIWQELGAA